MADIVGQLEQARQLAFSNRDVFPQVLRQVFPLATNPDITIQRWCLRFFKDAFRASGDKLDPGAKIDLAIDAVEALLVLVEVPDHDVVKNAIDASVVVFRLVYRYVADNDGSNGIWAKLQQLKTRIAGKYLTTWPLDAADTSEADMRRNVEINLELLKFVVVVIDYQLRSPTQPGVFSLSKVNPNHTLMKPQQLEADAHKLLEKVLVVLEWDILVVPIVTATLSQLAFVAHRKPQFVGRVFKTVDSFDLASKYQSNYESVDEFKLARKYADRAVRIFLNHALKYQLVPPNFHQAASKKVAQVTARGDEVRRRDILAIDDPSITKRKFDGFENASKRLQALDYKSLYCLTDPNNELNSFDLTTLPPNILVSMTIAALNKALPERLAKGLDIICLRYKHGLQSAAGSEVKKLELDDEDDNMENFSSDTVFTLPPPQALNFAEKKEHLSLIIQNFFSLADQKIPEVTGKQDTEAQLTQIAIKTWKKDSWYVLLTRLATRGMRSVPGEGVDVEKEQELADMVRQAIFDYFLANIHSRIDIVIEWLNEEWYAEKVFNEGSALQKMAQENNGVVTDEMRVQVDFQTTPTPIYEKWSSKVLDSMISFIEPGDRKIFIRLLSDLPYLTDEMVSRIKSLCYDPGRAKIGFLSLQFLVMYRPPVKSACLKVFKELAEGDQDDLKEEATKLMEKYS